MLTSLGSRKRKVQPVDQVRKEEFYQGTIKRLYESPGHHVSSTQPSAYGLAITREHPRMMKHQFHTVRVQAVDRLTIMTIRNMTVTSPHTIHRTTGQHRPLDESVAGYRNGTLNNHNFLHVVYRDFLENKPELLDPHALDAAIHIRNAPQQGALDTLNPSAAIAAAVNNDHSASTRKQRDAIMDMKRHQQSLLPENFAILQQQYENAADECQLTPEERKQYPYLGKEMVNPHG